MAKVQLADVVEPAIFLEYSIERTTNVSRLFRSGLISTDPRIEASARSGGRTVNMPFWQSLSGDSEVLSDAAALTPAKLGSDQDVAVLHMRGKAWSASDLAEAVAGDDPTSAIAEQTGDYWAVELQNIANSVIRGLFSATGALATTHAHDISTQDGDNAGATNLWNDDDFLEASFKLGDHEENLTAIAIHSHVYQEMLKQDVVQFDSPSEEGRVRTYRGRTLIVDDNLPVVAGTTSGFRYLSILFGPGAFGYGEGMPKNPLEFDRDSLANDDVLINRRHFILHPRGVAWDGSPAGAAPTNAELATVGNWTKVYTDKNIRMVGFWTN